MTTSRLWQWLGGGVLGVTWFFMPQLVWAAPVVTLTSNPSPATVPSGTSIDIIWTISGATRCTATDNSPWTGPWPTTSGSMKVVVTKQVTYYLECWDNTNASSGERVLVTQVSDVTLDLSANPTSVKAGNPVTVTWSSTGGSDVVCFLNDSRGPIGPQQQNGSKQLYPTESTTYTMTCVNYVNGSPRESSPTRSVPVTVTPGAPCTFMGNLVWMTNCSAYVSETLESGKSKAVANTQPGYIGSTTYSCMDGVFSEPTQTSCTASAPGKPSVIFTGSVTSLPAPGQATLSWQTSGVAGCFASGGWNGNITDLPNGSAVQFVSVTTTYYLDCLDSNGVSAGKKSVTVTVGGSGGGSGGGGGTGGGGGGPIDGRCAPTHNNCLAGTSSTPQEDGGNWYWNCDGISGGTRALCNEGKPSGGPGPTPTPGPAPSPGPGPSPAPGPGPSPIAPPNPTPSPSADSPSLIPCGRNIDNKNTTDIDETKPCTLCHIVLGGQGLVAWGLKIMAIIAITVIFAMGVLYILSAGNSGMMQTAKGGMIASLIGFAVMLSAYLIVNVILTILVDTASPDKPFLNLTATQGYFNFACDIKSNVNGK